MRTEQIILALNITREKSLKKAAKSLFISQPNASSMLKTLEKELGYALFERSPNGMLPTPKGAEYMKYAASIERSLQGISKIREPVQQVSLRVASVVFHFSVQAFTKISKKYCSEDYNMRLSFKNISSSEEGKKAIESGEADVVIALFRKGIYDTILHSSAKLNLETEIICKQQLVATCRKGHPIIKNGKIAYDLLGKYPAFMSIQPEYSDMYAPYFLSKHDIDIRKLITMDPGPARCELVREINGYLISMPIPDKIKADFDLESVAIKGTETNVFATYHKDNSKIDLIREYVGYCREFV